MLLLYTYMIPNCSIMNQHAMYIGLLASTTFVLLDNFYPHAMVYMRKRKKIKRKSYTWNILPF